MDVAGPTRPTAQPRAPRARRDAPRGRSSLLVLALAILGSSLHAGSNLLERSPFLPPDAALHAAAEATPLELRGIFQVGRECQFSLYDPARKQSTWVGLNEPGHEFLVKAFDPTHDTVTVEQRGRTFKLALKEARITPLTVASVRAPAGGGLEPPNPAATVVAAVDPSFAPVTPEEAQRHQSVVARIQENIVRRRAGLGRRAAPAPGNP